MQSLTADRSSLEFNGIIIKDKESLVVTAIVLGSQKKGVIILVLQRSEQ